MMYYIWWHGASHSLLSRARITDSPTTQWMMMLFEKESCALAFLFSVSRPTCSLLPESFLCCGKECSDHLWMHTPVPTSSTFHFFSPSASQSAQRLSGKQHQSQQSIKLKKEIASRYTKRSCMECQAYTFDQSSLIARKAIILCNKLIAFKY